MSERHTCLSESCLLCGQTSLSQVPGFIELPRITSDCRAYPPGGDLLVCKVCGAVQKLPSERWLTEIGEIYRDYSAYTLAGGEEQLVLDPETGRPAKRSIVLVQALSRELNFVPVGRALDVGCGHGVTISALSSALPGWSLSGYELGDGNLPELEKIDRFDRLYTGELTEIDDNFDFVSMIHSLEHFVDPVTTLCELRRLIRPGGKLFIEVCNVDENPFDLLVADHLTHFSPVSLTLALSRAGFDVIHCATDWVKKELSIVAEPAHGSRLASRSSVTGVLERVTSNVRWLSNLVDSAKIHSCNDGLFGIFGTSIAATWLATALGERVDFFVDEDPHRVGREYMGKPVMAPSAVHNGARVFLALAPTLAESIGRRLEGLPIRIIMPSPAA